MDMPAQPENFEFAKTFWDLATKLVASQLLNVLAVYLGSVGLEGVLKGLDELKEGKVSGLMLVYRIDGKA